MANDGLYPGEDISSVDRIRHAFGLLASVVLEQWPSWTHRFDPAQLRSRVVVLAELLAIVPSAGMRHLGKVVDGWHLAFPKAGIVTLSQLRDVAKAVLKAEDRLASSAQGSGLRRALALVAP